MRIGDRRRDLPTTARFATEAAKVRFCSGVIGQSLPRCHLPMQAVRSHAAFASEAMVNRSFAIKGFPHSPTMPLEASCANGSAP
jgi:hypothetical protein